MSKLNVSYIKKINLSKNLKRFVFILLMFLSFHDL